MSQFGGGGAFGNPSGFGNPPQQGGFGGGFGSPSGFGTGGPTTNPPSTQFGTSTSTPFGGPATSGGFGVQPSTSTQAPSFGSSPNVVAGNANAGQSFSSGNTGFGAGSNVIGGSGQGFQQSQAVGGGFSNMNQSQSTFGTPVQNNPFQTGASTATPAGNPPVSFGKSNNLVGPSSTTAKKNPNAWGQSSTPGQQSGFGSTNPFGTGNKDNLKSTPFSQSSGFKPASRTKQPRNHNETTMADSDNADMASDGKDDDRLKANKEEKKRLQAIIEEKKRKLLEKKKNRSQQGSSPRTSPTPDSDRGKARISSNGGNSMNPAAPAFVPQKSMNKAQLDLAQRNAVRFGQMNRTPADTESKSKGGYIDKRTKDDREHLDKAVSLVGTCPYMCPEDELQTRERENNILLLELPLPGKLHPQNWSIRDTAIKRFRRSAADYKLDVPEWVRPPDVLEKVCGYIEEWLMERDRQGPDPRFANNQQPPSLDVYQFIWDRTRMIRKDFTLQNYVGTGGKCDARAVRCHERICRWHALSEHQLSHIPAFVTNQSQQNIQELGQTMKTLNQFYDDSMNRSVIEVPDANGKETRLDLSNLSHGCTVDNVQGCDPVENGKPLNNQISAAAVNRRLIGKHAVNLPSHGTAEPEMRGLYILLTIDNDGGMEVLKYAGKLFRERPAVYHSRPVQLALTIYKVKKEYNYAKFFSILKSPSTPYLFNCVMFKYVELMRKVAFRIMFKAFGARKKDSGETIYDQYPLSRLTELLCFEDSNEAREACKHYNITVRDHPSPSPQNPNGTQAVIFWKQSDFKEPKHPEKGFILPLKPRKMTRIVESKLNGATRLAICRGEVSGEGASLAMPATASTATSADTSGGHASSSSVADSLAQKQQAELEKLMKEEEERRRKEEVVLKAKIKERKQKELEERKRKEAQARLAREHERRAAEECRKQEAEKRRKEEEARRLQAFEEQKRQEAERRRLEEEARKARERELQRKELEERMRKEAEARLAREREQRAAEEKRRKEEEERQRQEQIRRMEALRLEIERKKRQEAEARKRKREWKAKSDKCRRLILWSRWKRRLSRRLAIVEGAKSRMSNIDPTFTGNSLDLEAALQSGFAQRAASDYESRLPVSNVPDPKMVIEQLRKNENDPLSLPSLVSDAIRMLPISSFLNDRNGRQYSEKTTVLLKVAVIVPTLFSHTGQNISELVRFWIASRLGAGKVFSKALNLGGDIGQLEVRSTVALSPNEAAFSGCDVAIFVVPPSPVDLNAMSREFQSASSSLGDGVPGLALVLADPSDMDEINDMLSRCMTGSEEGMVVVHPVKVSLGAFNSALESLCKRTVDVFLQERCMTVGRLPARRLPIITVLGSLWRNMSSHLDSMSILKLSRYALDELELELSEQLEKHNALWPASEFARNEEVEKYFSAREGLPLNWISSLTGDQITQEVASLRTKLDGPFSTVMSNLLVDATSVVVEECNKFTSQQSFRKCLETALTHSLNVGNAEEYGYIYLPTGLAEEIVENAIKRAEFRFDVSLRTNALIKYSPPPPTPPPYNEGFVSEPEDAGENSYKSHGLKRLGSEPQQDDSISPMNPSLPKRRRLQEDIQAEHNTIPQSENLEESAAFTQTLLKLASGEKILDTQVGDTTLSRLLEGVPAIIE